MKRFASILASVVFLAPAATGAGYDDHVVTYTPRRISFRDLVGGNEDDLQPTSPSSGQILLDALQDFGMISITDIPLFDAVAMMTSLPSCLDETVKSGGTVAEHTFRDGTRRRSLATHSLEGEVSPIHHQSGKSGIDACESFDQASAAFREIVAQVAHAFGRQLSLLLNLSEPILFSESGSSYSFADVVQKGEHLEHFHCYQSHPQAPTESHVQKPGSTIDWHIDQGLALIFAPGRINGKVTDGFYIRMSNGSAAMVQFDDEADELVILLGDMIDQFVNPAIEKYAPSLPLLRAVPHALAIPSSNEPGEPTTRVWYGRMVLPPAEAVHPMHQRTFGEIRQGLIEATIHDEVIGDENSENDRESDWLSLSCASRGMRALQASQADCLKNELFCWHSCWNYTADMSPTVCAKQNQSLACINDQRQLWAGDHNAAFHPGCVDLATAVNYTFPPTLAPSRKPLPLPPPISFNGTLPPAAAPIVAALNGSKTSSAWSMRGGGVGVTATAIPIITYWTCWMTLQAMMG